MKVLIVDDSKFLRKAVGALLTSRGYRVCEAADGESVLSIARQERPDVILLDMVLPKLSGTDVLCRLGQNASTAQIPVVMLTGTINQQELCAAFAAGAKRCLLKDNLQLSEVVLALEQAASATATNA